MKKPLRFLLALTFLLFSFTSFAQLKDFSNIPDSLKVKSSGELHKIIKSQIIDSTLYKPSIVYVNTLLERAERENSLMDIVRANNYLFHISKSIGDYKGSIEYIDTAIEIAEQHNFKDFILSILYRNKGNAHFLLNEYDEALKFYFKDYDIVKEQGNYDVELSVIYNIALVKLDSGDKKDAKKIILSNLKAYDSLQKLGIGDYKEAKAKTLNGLGRTYTDFRKYDSAHIIYDESYELSKDKYLVQVAYTLAGKGNVYSLEKKFEEALPYLESSTKLSDSLHLKDLIPYIYLHKGRTYYGLKKYTKAISYLNKIDSLVNANEFKSYEIQEYYALLANAYDQLGNDEKSKENFKKFISVDTKNDDEKIDIVSTIYEDFNLKNLKTKIEKLSQESDDQKQMLGSTKVIIFFLILIILFLFGFFQYRARQNQKRFEALLNKPTSVKKLKTVSKAKKIDRKKLIPEEKAQELLQKLQKLEKQEVFLDQNCTIAWLAKKMGTNASYASIIINDFRQKKFPEYLSELRIDYATERLKEDSKFRSYTIKSIAKDVGYKSSEAFSKSFKKINGIYPSYFIKKLNQQAQNAA